MRNTYPECSKINIPHTMLKDSNMSFPSRIIHVVFVPNPPGIVVLFLGNACLRKCRMEGFEGGGGGGGWQCGMV